MNENFIADLRGDRADGAAGLAAGGQQLRGQLHRCGGQARLHRSARRGVRSLRLSPESDRARRLFTGGSTCGRQSGSAVFLDGASRMVIGAKAAFPGRVRGPYFAMNPGCREAASLSPLSPSRTIAMARGAGFLCACRARGRDPGARPRRNRPSSRRGLGRPAARHLVLRRLPGRDRRRALCAARGDRPTSTARTPASASGATT